MPIRERHFYEPEIFHYKGSLCEIELEIFRVFGFLGVNTLGENFSGPSDLNGIGRGLEFRILSKVLLNSNSFSEIINYDGFLGKMTIEVKKVVGAPGVGYEGEIDEYGNAFGLEIKKISSMSK